MPCRQHRCSHLLHFQLQWRSDGTFLVRCWGGKQKRDTSGNLQPAKCILHICFWLFISELCALLLQDLICINLDCVIWFFFSYFKFHSICLHLLNHACMHSRSLATNQVQRKSAAATQNNNASEQWMRTRTKSSKQQHILKRWAEF